MNTDYAGEGFFIGCDNSKPVKFEEMNIQKTDNTVPTGQVGRGMGFSVKKMIVDQMEDEEPNQIDICIENEVSQE